MPFVFLYILLLWVVQTQNHCPNGESYGVITEWIGKTLYSFGRESCSLNMIQSKKEKFSQHFPTFFSSCSLEWSAVIVDEAHRIKNPKARITEVMKALKCNVRIGLTGTILQNNMKELWCVMDWWVKSNLSVLENFSYFFNLILPCLLINSF